MDFTLTQDQLMLQRMLRDFANNELQPKARQVDDEAKADMEAVRKLNELGVCGLGIPDEYGGSGGGITEIVIASEEIFRGCAGTAITAIGSLVLCGLPILHFGTDEQKRRFVTPIAKGDKFGAFGLTETGAGSDILGIATTAVKRDGGYLLNGTKIFITNGGIADIVVVFATLDRKLGRRGLTAFVVEKGMSGFCVGKEEHKLGIRGSSTAELIFDNCFVPEANRLGKEGEGFKMAMQCVDHSRVAVAAQAIGIARAAYEASVQYAKQRQQFGQPIASFQAIQFMLADMATNIDAARLLTYRAAYLQDHGLPYVKEAAMAKVFASETAMAVTTKAIQIHGGYGYIKDYPVERHFRDAKIMEIYEGTSEMQRLTIAAEVLRD